MNHKRFLSISLAVAMLSMLPAATSAQSEDVGPEGVDWALTGYLDGGQIAVVPIAVDATLRLEDGVASGSGGCNTFSGSYQLDGQSLTFDPEMSRTLMACPGDADTVEMAYLSSLMDVAEWAIAGEELRLSDDFGELLLTFEVPGIALTSADLAALLARMDTMQEEIAALDQRIDNIRIGKLRDRLEALEASSASLRKQVADLGQSSGPRTSIAFNNAEKILLEGVPARIANFCRPLRERLPAGTAAAVQCSPNTASVSEMAYYLMNSSSAIKLLSRKMKAQGVDPVGEMPPPDYTGCAEGDPGWIGAPGGYVGGIGCYTENGRANLRIIHQVTDCKQLMVGGKQLKRPTMYVALTGPDDDIESLHAWSMRNKDNLEISGLVKDIQRPNAKDSPNCFAG